MSLGRIAAHELGSFLGAVGSEERIAKEEDEDGMIIVVLTKADNSDGSKGKSWWSRSCGNFSWRTFSSKRTCISYQVLASMDTRSSGMGQVKKWR